VFTGIYVWLTHQLLQEARNARLESDRSEVTADVVSVETLFMFRVKNIGKRPAVNVETKTDQPILNLNGEEMKGFRKISGLGPGEERRYIMTVAHRYFQEERPRTIIADISWEDAVLGTLTRQAVIDMESY